MRREVTGGNILCCLSNVDIDRVVGKFNARYIEAIAFFDARTAPPDSPTPRQLRKRLEQVVGKFGRAVLPVHIRHHWTAAIIIPSTSGDNLAALVVDSAPSLLTAMDIRKGFGLLGITEIDIGCHGRQPYGSDECGLFTILTVLRDQVHFDGIMHEGQTTAEMSLAGWRKIMADPAFVVRSTADVRTLVDACPIVADFLPLTPGRVEGGATFLLDDSGEDDTIDLCGTNLEAIPPDEEGPGAMFNVWEEGVDIGANLIDYAVAQFLAESKDCPWSVIPTVQLGHFAASGARRHLPPIDKGRKYAAVLHIPVGGGHFFLASYDGRRIEVRDSVCPAEIDPARQTAITAFWEAIAGPGPPPLPQVTLMTVERQHGRDCGLHAVNNLVHVISGRKGTWSRAQVHEAWLASPATYHFRFKATELPCATQEIIAATERCTKCKKRPAVANGLCVRHHPLVVPQGETKGCTAITARAKPCQHRAVGVMGITTCLDHLSAANERRLARWLKDPSAPLAHDPYDNGPRYTPTIEKRALAYATVRATLRAIPVGAVVEVQFGDVDGQHGVSVARVVQQPRLVAPAKLIVLNRLCPKCGKWTGEGGREIVVPESPLSYFSIKEINYDLGNVAVDCCCGEQFSSDDEEDPAFPDEGPAAAQAKDANDPDRACATSFPIATGDSSLRALMRDRYVYDKKPEHVTEAAWSFLTPATRAKHVQWLISARNAPPELANAPIPQACEALVMRKANERGWSWPTISTNLSAMATAMAKISFYTNGAGASINLRHDPYFSDVLQNAARKARIAALHPRKASPLSEDNMRAVAKSVEKCSALLLLHLSWFLAGRVGDVRKLQRRHLTFGVPDHHGLCGLTATFVEGKGAVFWGPYTIHTKIPKDIANAIWEFVKTKPFSGHIFSPSDQCVLAQAVGALPDHSLRSIRKGSLVHLARQGVSDNALQLLSGHKRKETLLRYLGWGMESADAKRAAEEVGETRWATPMGGGDVSTLRPTRMGPFSGYQGQQGRRVQRPPQMLANKAPTSRALGIAPPLTADAQWPLHTKNVDLVDYFAIASQVRDPELRDAVAKAIRWLTSAETYGIDWAPQTFAQIPVSTFTKEQVQAMSDCGKIVAAPPHALVRCAAKGFTVPEPAKQRHRPIFEPANNSVIDKSSLPPLAYPSRLERRTLIADKRFVAQFDFSAWYDQIQLGIDVRDCFAIRTRESINVSGIETNTFFLTREPMGSSHSAHVAQTLTWAILEPILAMDVTVCTMIDNVLIASDSADAFATAVQMFVARCRQFGATLNDADSIPSTRADVIAWGRRNVADGITFLGETHRAGTVCNTARNIEKMRAAFERIQRALNDRSYIVTKRNLAAAVSLSLFLAHTLQIPLCKHYELLRLFGRLESSTIAWDDPYPVTPQAVNTVGAIVGPILANIPVRPTATPLPCVANVNYDILIVVDASKTGFGAYVQVGDRLFVLRSGWRNLIQHSAWAEPLAAREVLAWVRNSLGAKGRTAIVTDHIAMALGQRRPLSGNAGFSKAYHLNAFFADLYATGDECQVFFVEGEKNPADGPSRSCRIKDAMTVTEIADSFISPLSTFWHPYADLPQRRWWNV